MNWDHVLDRLLEMTHLGLLAAFGAVAKYLHQTTAQGLPFVAVQFFVNLIISFIVGNIAGEFIPHDNYYRDGIVMVTGYCAFPLLFVIEAVFIQRAKDIITSFMPKK